MRSLAGLSCPASTDALGIVISIQNSLVSPVSLCVLSLLPLCPVMAQEEDAVPYPELTEVIREVRADEPRLELDAAELLRRCAGSLEAYTFLFERLETRRVPAFEGQAGQTLSESQAQLILDAFAKAPMDRVLAVRDMRLSELKAAYEGTPEKFAHASADARAAAVQVTGITGDLAGVDFIFEIALVGNEEKLSRASESIFEEALLRLLLAEPRGIDRLLTSWYAGSTALIVPAIRAVGRAGNSGSLSFIEEIIRWSPDHIPAAAAQISVLGPSCLGDQNERLGEVLVDQIEYSDPALCIAIGQALGGLRSEVGIESMIDMLTYEVPYDLQDKTESTERRVREMALWSLQQITTRRFGGDPKIWKLWLKEEQRWLKESSNYWIKRLGSQDLGASAEAIRTISKRRYGRDTLALAVARLLDVGHDEVKPMACAALANLGSKPAMPWLLEALDHESKVIAEAALTALRALTGKDLPMDRETWCMALPEEAQYGW